MVDVLSDSLALLVSTRQIVWDGVQLEFLTGFIVRVLSWFDRRLGVHCKALGSVVYEVFLLG